jgi:DNA-binding transcriptional LysR family regulator
MDAALTQLSDALQALTSASRSAITIASSHDIASMWLIPRLNRFRSKHPDVEIRLVVGDDYAQFDKEDVDVSLRFGKGRWNGWQSVRLFDEEVYAVCAPSLIARYPELRRLRSPSDILAAPLLHIAPTRGVDWYSWFKALRSRAPRSATMSYPSYLTSLDAAANGEGVALCWKSLNEGIVGRGRLERLGPWTVKGDESLYVLYRPSSKPEVRSLVEFLQYA